MGSMHDSLPRLSKDGELFPVCGKKYEPSAK